MMDLVVDRREMKAAVAGALRFMGTGIATTAPVDAHEAVDPTEPVVETS
jgi:hypothetical protein